VATSTLFIDVSQAANDITDVVVTVSPINAWLHFNTTDASDYVYIKFDTDSDTTDGTQTYTDPDDLMGDEFENLYYGDRDEGTVTTERYMLLRGLNESTHYYYTIYIDGVANTDGQFNTTACYTDVTGFGDEFIDETYVEATSGVSLSQATGSKSGSLGLGSFSGSTVMSTYNYNNEYHLWSGRINENYQTSPSGVTWTNEGSFSVSGVSEPVAHYVWWDYDNDKWNAIVMEGSGGNHDIYTTSATLGNERAWSSTTKIMELDSVGVQRHSVDPHGLMNNSLAYNMTEMFANWHYNYGAEMNHYSPRFATFVYEIPGTDHLKWISINVTKMHRTESYGFGLRDALVSANVANHTYGGDYLVRNQMYLGLLNTMQSVNLPTSNMWVYLITSRNGYDWSFFNISVPILDISPSGWDGGTVMVYPFSVQTVGDTDRIYYMATDGPHDSPGNTNVGYIEFRHKGLTYAKPTGTSGWLRTEAIDRKFAANLTINGDFSSSAKLNISILDADTNIVYSGYSNSDFDTIITDSLTTDATWGSNDLSDIPDGDFKILFTWDGVGSGELYSYDLDGYSTAPDAEDNSGVSSFNSGSNGSFFRTSTPTISWEISSDKSSYHLQFATDANFSNIVVNLSNINEYNYPSRFAIDGSYGYFTLPPGYEVSTVQAYYIRVISYSR